MTDQRSLASSPTVSGDYDDSYYGEYGGGHLGPPYTYEEPHWQRFFGGIADELVALFAPATYYDAGCAKGFLVRAMADRGVDAFGGDISAHAIQGAPAGLLERLEVKDLTQPFDERYDLMTCIEVLEHMDAAGARTAIKNLCAATDVILMSSTPADFAEPTHINVRTQPEWAMDFAKEGFYRRTDVDASFVAPWAVVYQRSAATPVQVVGAYEALLTPLNLEVVAKRRALLEAQRDLSEALSPVNAAIKRALAERDRVEGELDVVAGQRDALAADRQLIANDRERLAAHIEALEKVRSDKAADVQAERMSRLAMADENVGLRAELAEVRISAEMQVVEAGREAVRLRAVLEATERDLEASQADLTEARRVVTELTGSSTWRIGRAAMAPVRLVRLPKRIVGALARRTMKLLRR